MDFPIFSPIFCIFEFLQVNNNKKIPDPEELNDAEEDAKTRSLCTAVIPPIKTSIVEKTSTTFLGKNSE